MDVDDDDDENEDESGTVYDQVWCDSYGKWHRYDEWDYDDNYDYDDYEEEESEGNDPHPSSNKRLLPQIAQYGLPAQAPEIEADANDQLGNP